MKLKSLTRVAISILACATVTVAYGQAVGKEKSGFVTASDGARIHYVEAGTAQTAGSFQIQPAASTVTNGQVALSNIHQGPAILFVPGWTMPAWIWQKQIDHFSTNRRVLAMDPRCQGESAQTNEGLYPAQMARDIKSVVDQLHLAPVVLVGWSMAVVEVLSYIDQFGTRDLAGLVLVDDAAGGFVQGEAEQDFALLKNVLAERQNTTEFFVRKIQFHKPQPEDYIQRVIQASMKVPTNSAVALLVGLFAADYRGVLAKIDRPALVCAAKGPDFNRVAEMQKQIAGSKLEVFAGAGHALFVDNAEQFNAALDAFLGGLK